MNKTILNLYERLEKLISKLPVPLQKPILQEMTPVKNLFLRQRSPRIVIAGEPGPAKAHLLNALFDAEILPAADAAESIFGWHEYVRVGKGALRVLDTRFPGAENPAKTALANEAPDIFLFLHSVPGDAQALAAEVEKLDNILAFQNQRSDQRAAVIGVLVKSDPSADVEEAKQQLHVALHSKAAVGERLAATLALTALRFRLDGTLDETSVDRTGLEILAQTIAEELPEEARLEMARLCGVRAVQIKIAQTLIKAFTAICAAIGAQPIPLADFPILTGLQVVMISGIMHISGREMSVKLAGEFVSALGANVGAGLVLREGSRALLKLLPGWGNAISGTIAGAGTYALGRAAIAYFIEGVNLKDAQKFLKRKNRREAISN